MSMGKLLIANKNASRTLNINGAKLDFAPRTGLAYAPVNSTVIRAGFGTYYGQIMSNLGGQISFPGYDVPVSYSNLGTRTAQPFTLSQGMPLTGVQDFNHPENAVNLTAHTGFPLTVTQTNEYPGVMTQRPNRDTSSLAITPYRNGSGIQLLKPANGSAFPSRVLKDAIARTAVD